MASRGFVIAVDGPAASGKGTIAARLARLWTPYLSYLDTGLLYRAVGLVAKQRGKLDDPAWVVLHSMPETMDHLEYRTREVGELASQVAADPKVRAALLDFQRDWARRDPRGAVLDGRDIGTVIVPDAPAKLYVTATPEVRAERRWRQLLAQGEAVTLEDILADIRVRDARDGGRDIAPMQPAADAYLLDTTDKTIDAAFDEARRFVEQARAAWEQSRSG